jgi:hypothetical protein
MVDEKAELRMRIEDLEFDAWRRDVMTFESECKTKFIKNCRKIGAYARRIEDQFAVGVLDMIVVFEEYPVCFLEGKVVEHQSFGPTERQYVEGCKILSLEGGHSIPLLVAWDKQGGFYIHEWTRKANITDSYSEQGKNDAAILRNFLYKRNSRIIAQHSDGNIVRGQ